MCVKKGSTNSDSECVGKCIWFCYTFGFQKIPHFNNQTHFEMMAKMRNMTMEEMLAEMGKKYKDFVETGKPV
ncbi:hypothetical protein KY311_02940 [Candidatus Woesearchaeota archaeon]|nr:hypothetical protein [Candidatus Woesearchaeota archaeon]